MTAKRLAIALIVLAAVVPYLPTLNDYFAQDDFGVVGLLASKPAGYFPRWFTMPWTEDIWGYVPDEIRPFPAVTYQFAGIFGAASPVANHVINVLFHAANALLVFAIARAAAGLPMGPAAFAGLVFALLPMQTESVAWVTGRVDSMPACFYMASFLLYVQWRSRRRVALYWWSAAWFFVALFTKQNTVTLLPALVLADWMLLGRRPRLSWEWMRPYVPFALMTAGFLALRYILFGEVARESTLTAERVRLFLGDLSTHFRRLVFGEPGLKVPEPLFAGRVAVAGALVYAVHRLFGDRDGRGRWRVVAYFSAVWIGLGVAPTVVAGYASPRHMYLASVGYAIVLGVGLDVFWRARPEPAVRRVGIGLACAVLIAYTVLLSRDVRLWGTRTSVSRAAVLDIRREALAAPRGTLILAGAPRRSWDFALPHAIRPPFVDLDVTKWVTVISQSMVYCCPAALWEPNTRKAIRGWLDDPARPPVIALRWDADTGRLTRLSDREDPFLRSLVGMLLDTKDIASMDRLILDILDDYVVGRTAGSPGASPPR
jgi:hypothetical protein